MILCIGEILVDMIGEEREGVFSYQRKAGGAPFNVACALAKFQTEATFVGSVGQDIIGDYLIKYANKKGLAEVLISQDPLRNTTLAFVELDASGERSFCFYRKNTADTNLPAISDELLQKSNIVHIGSLMLSEEAGVKYAKQIMHRAHTLGKMISFDVNFRTDIFKDKEQAISIYKEIISLADIVKFSEDEVDIFHKEYIEKELINKLVCISLGKDGSIFRYKELKEKVSSISITPVDTTGAGDAFYAGILSKLDNRPSQEWTKEFLRDTFLFGNVCGALNTLGKGAIDHLPSLGDVLKYKEKLES